MDPPLTLLEKKDEKKSFVCRPRNLIFCMHRFPQIKNFDTKSQPRAAFGLETAWGQSERFWSSKKLFFCKWCRGSEIDAENLFIATSYDYNKITNHLTYH